MSAVKDRISVRILALSVLIYAFASYFSQDRLNLHKVDVYFFVEKLRYPENIALDIAELAAINLLIYTIYSLIQQRQQKRYARCFLIYSLLGIPAYFLIYSQGFTLYGIPLLIGFIAYEYRRNRNEKRNNNRAVN